VTTVLADIIARNIRLERSNRRWKQEQLAAMLGWETATVLALEAGTKRLDMEALPALCRVFGISLAKLIDGADPEDFDALGL
jgi:transcriptional regulator with XRE-family HTH domain